MMMMEGEENGTWNSLIGIHIIGTVVDRVHTYLPERTEDRTRYWGQEM